ncbi:MAG: phytoene desaturase family protein [Candidatus Bathyarchaeia archaeon]
MPEKFDCIVIGGGHNGLIAAGYLARAGLSVLVLERRSEAGGGLCTEEVTLPGFRHNLHSAFHSNIFLVPWFNDLECAKYGAKYIEPPVKLGGPISNGQSRLIYDDNEKTAKFFEKFSRKDAETWRRLIGKWDRVFNQNPILGYDLFTPPLPAAEREELLSRSELGREYLEISKLPPMKFFDEAFEDEYLKGLLLYSVACIAVPHDEPDPSAMVVRRFTLKRALCRGGSHMLAHVLARSLVANGGLVRENADVKRIRVKGDVATGVELSDGVQIEAGKAVISAIDITQTFLEMIGEDHLEANLASRVKSFKYGPNGVLFGVHLALEEPPKYTAANWSEDVNLTFDLNIGYETQEDMDQHWKEIREGLAPSKPGMQCGVFTLFDPTQAPPGKHAAFLWQFAPYSLREGGPAAWDSEFREEYAWRCIGKWAKYAPNLTKENVLGMYIYTPLDVERKHINMREGDFCVGGGGSEHMFDKRPLPELSQYRTPIKHLYLSGACTHFGGGIIGAGGHNAAVAVLMDLGTKPWWKVVDIRDIYAKLKDAS